MDLRYNNPLTPILIYFKVPKEEYDINNLAFEFDEEPLLHIWYYIRRWTL